MKEKSCIPDFSLEGKVVFVTGAMGLIGKVVCEAFSQSGASLAIADITPMDQMNAFAASLENDNGYPAISLNLDITDETSIRNSIDTILTRFGRIDVLVHLAAIDAKFDANVDQITASSYEEFPLSLWQRSVDVNMTGTFLITQAVAKVMKKQKSGNIITVPSTYSLVAPNQDLYLNEQGEQVKYKPVDYVATKSFIPNFTRYLATYYGKSGIRVNALVPHGVWNNHDANFEKRFSAMNPLGRMCDPKELRGPFVFLASDASSYMTGSVLTVDGGWTAW